MDFSIVVPIYNIAKYLPECIESILGQSYKNFELILVNDGSTDGSDKICHEFAEKDERIVVVDKPNGGLVSARKAGFSRCRGKYTISVDGDDFVDKDLLRCLNDRLEETNADIAVYQGYSYTDGAIKEITQPLKGYYEKSKNWTEVEKYLIGGITTSAKWIMPGIVFKALKTEILKKNLVYYDDRVSMGEDLVISTACIFDAKDILFLDDRLYYYRQFIGQMTNRYKKNLVQNEEVLIDCILKAAEDKGCLHLKTNILRHALELSKSAIYNEVKYGKSRKETLSAIKCVMNSSYFSAMKDMDVKLLTKMEKIFRFLLVNKLKYTIYFVAKLYYRGHHD